MERENERREAEVKPFCLLRNEGGKRAWGRAWWATPLCFRKLAEVFI